MKQSKELPLIALGVVFWLAAALFIRLFGPAVFSENNPKLILVFVLAFPVSYGFILISKKLGNLQKPEILRAVTIMTTTATFLDGVALAWFRQLYAQSFEVALYGAAWILWGVGAGLLLGYCLTGRNNS
ncbi:DUF5367 family protein [Hymenobacter terrenus]|uniref:DUF5367 family protein n=1 Tax=Hymenobacter terrenus TaxID=1629124 RepID=UPI0018CD2878|nr:DUF5367 family protein [Hymenobacter terrenus]